MSEISIHRLNSEWERLRLKYGIASSPPGLDRLLLTSRRKQARLRDLKTRLGAIQAEVDALDLEVAGLDKTIRYFLSDVIGQIEAEHGPSWSPVPMLGFRVWQLKNGEFHGYRVRWEHRSLSAICAGGAGSEDIPHTGGECADPPCGIYAAKSVDRLIASHSSAGIDSMAIGLVAMTGKVVEHEEGWRAERVTVLALTFVRGDRIMSTSDPEEIELLFQGIGLSDDWHPNGETSMPSRTEDAMAAYMKEQERRQAVWILESPNEL